MTIRELKTKLQMFNDDDLVYFNHATENIEMFEGSVSRKTIMGELPMPAINKHWDT